jgi:hypothetical protein
MPAIINYFVQKVLTLVREFFQAERFEYGVFELTPADNGRIITVPTTTDTLRVWFSVQKHDHPYHDHYAHSCKVSDAVIVPGGFQFHVETDCPCRVSWFAIEV